MPEPSTTNSREVPTGLCQNPGGYSIKLFTGRLFPDAQTLTLKYTIFIKMTPFSHSQSKNFPQFFNLKDKPKQQFPTIAIFPPGFQSPWFICSKAPSFRVASRCYFGSQIWQPFICLPFNSCHLFLLQAYYVTLLYTKITIFPLPFSKLPLKKEPFSGASLPV